MMLRAVSLIASTLSINALSEPGWSYKDQSKQWAVGAYEDSCGGKRQSPINIEAASAKKATVADDVDARKIIEVINDMTFTANMSDPSDHASHAIKFTPSEKAANGKVKCEQFHFHMNTSEHTVDGRAYFGEVHMVCFKDRNADFTAAVAENKTDSLAVFGFFLEKSDTAEPDKNVQAIIELVNAHSTGAEEVTVKLPTAKSLAKYYRYMGGLTTPPCNEIVEWTVFADTVKISAEQADAINGWNPQLTQNNRKTLPLGAREVTYYDNTEADSEPETDSEEPTVDYMYIIICVAGVLILVGLFMFMRSRSKKETHTDAEGQPLK